jgi:hypothetical protein
MQSSVRNEIYINSFYKHPFVVNNTSVKGYILIKTIIEMITENKGYRDFDYHLKPTDIIINQIDNSHFNVIVPNNRYNNTLMQTYENSEFNEYEFLIETEEGMINLASEYIERTIHYQDIQTLHNHLLNDARKPDVEPREPREQNETTYDNSSCPVCFDDYEETTKKVAICGHTLCLTCWEHIIGSSNCRCPECREVWDEINENEFYTERDLRIMCDEEDDELYNIIDIPNLVNSVLEDEEIVDILNFEEEYTNDEGFDTPDKYRQLQDGGNTFQIFVKRD